MNDLKKIPETLDEALTLASNLQGNLAERLAIYRAYAKKLRPDFAAAYDRLVAHLEALDAGKIGPQVGERMPDFLLPNQQGQLVSLDTFLDLGPVVISMNRGHWCPYCKLDLRALAEIATDIRRLGAQLVSIMPEKAQFTKQAIANNDFPFPVLSDIDLSYALSLGLIFWVGAEVKNLYADIGIDLEHYQGNRNYFLPVAARFIVDRDGMVKAREVNVDFRLRMAPKAIIDILTRL